MMHNWTVDGRDNFTLIVIALANSESIPVLLRNIRYNCECKGSVYAVAKHLMSECDSEHATVQMSNP